MKRVFFFCFFCFSIANLAKAPSPVAFTFLTVSPSARGAALAEALTAVGGDVSSGFWNPALFLETKGSSFSAQDPGRPSGQRSRPAGCPLAQARRADRCPRNFRHIGD